MEILNAKETDIIIDDEFLNFTLEAGGEKEDFKISFSSKNDNSASPALLKSSNLKTTIVGPDTQTASFLESVEEDLEWLSNKDAFPTVETCFGVLSVDSELTLDHLSPVSVLDSINSNSNNNGNCNTVASFCRTLKVPTNHPVGVRSRKRKRRMEGFGELPSQKCLWSNQVNVKIKQESSISLPPLLTTKNSSGASMGRRCLHCQADKTPQWRAGPMGPKTLCNACGVRYKSGRLLPEYRPATSPTFSSVLHSNAHRKVVEMRIQKQQVGMVVNGACGYAVG